MSFCCNMIMQLNVQPSASQTIMCFAIEGIYKVSNNVLSIKTCDIQSLKWKFALNCIFKENV